MANRPIFAPLLDGRLFILEKFVDFKWHPGMATSQKQKSIGDLHRQASSKFDLFRPLEISSKSENPLGVALSSFNLRFTTKKGRSLTVETAFQGSKVFERGGPFVDIFDLTPREAKRDVRLQESGNLINFRFFGTDWPLKPRTAFYDWLYINALLKNEELSLAACDFDYFTDIEFNPLKSLNCQARSLAIFVSLKKREILDYHLRDIPTFLEIYRHIPQPKSEIYGKLL